MSDSIRNASTGTESIPYVKLMLSTGTTCVFIFVEGNSDYDLYKKFLSKDTSVVQLLKSYGGKPQVIEAVNYFQKNQVVGIVDSDFEVLLQNPSIQKIFRTDYHDLELLIINAGAWNSVFEEYYQAADSSADIIKCKILKSLELIGNGKLINYLETLELNFSSLKPHEYYSVADDTLDIEKYITDLHTRSPNKRRMIEKKEFEDFSKSKEYELWYMRVASFESKTEYLLHLCCGHDFLCLFAHIVRNKRTHWHPPTSDDISRTLRAAYSFEMFSHTRLYTTLQEYLTSLGKNIWDESSC